MRYLRAPGSPCARAARRFAGLQYVPPLYVLRAQIPANGSARHLVRGSLCVVRELLCISGGIKIRVQNIGCSAGSAGWGEVVLFCVLLD